MRRSLAVLLLLGLCLVSSGAAASERRVGLLAHDPELLRALAVALDTWDVETVDLDAHVPTSSQPEALAEAASLTQQLRLSAVVWLTETDVGSLLWIYDAEGGEITTRAVAARQPFASATAAGIALSVKATLHRAPEPSASPPTPLPPPPPRAALRPVAAAPSAIVPAPRVQTDAALEAQRPASDALRAWFSLRSVVWLGAHRALGLGLGLGAGSAVAIDDARFTGTFREVGFGPRADFRALATRHWLASLGVDSALHASFLNGTVSADASHSEARRYRTSIGAGARVELRLGATLCVGLSARLLYFVGYQRYLVNGATVFEPWRLVPSGGAHVGFEL